VRKSSVASQHSLRTCGIKLDPIVCVTRSAQRSSSTRNVWADRFVGVKQWTVRLFGC
jgi:hypothetical protein